ncbi:MAG: hypothetical protein WD232_07375 [Acidimicrobiales bacterium]
MDRPLRDELEKCVTVSFGTAAVGLRQHDVDVLAGGADGDPPELALLDVIANLESKSIPVEAQRLLGIMHGDEHRRHGNGHERDGTDSGADALLRSCSVWVVRATVVSESDEGAAWRHREARPRAIDDRVAGTPTGLPLLLRRGSAPCPVLAAQQRSLEVDDDADEVVI